MSRVTYLLFGVLAYIVFFLTFLYLVAFVGDLPWVPRTVDHPASGMAAAAAGLIDLALVAVFGLQHSVMARSGFKSAWKRVVPEPVERSTYVVFASLALIVMFLFWQPIGPVIWSFENTGVRVLFWGLFATGWLIVLLSTYMISHFELFGLKQVWDNLRGRAAAAPLFRQPLFYRVVRHPLYTGFFLAFWATPRMTAGHLLLAAGMSVYMLIAIRYEERDLVTLFGDDYHRYRTTTGMLVPRFGRRGG